MNKQSLVTQNKGQKRKVSFWIRTLLGILAIISLIFLGILWILSYGRVISNDWYGALLIIFTVLATIFAFCQWFYPLSTSSIQPLPVSNHYESISSPSMEKTFLWNVPYHRNPFFTGRENVLKQLHNNLSSGKTTALTQPQAINGLGGIGKTQCVIEYAYRYSKEYHYVLWVHAETNETLTTSFVNIASLLALPEQNEQEQSKVVASVKRWLADHNNWLLILDNADDLSMVFSYVPTLHKGHILLTTREQNVGGLAQGIEVNEMDVQEGTLMLLRRAKVITDDIPLKDARQQAHKQAEAIVREMEGLPLALDQAGAYVEENHCTFKEYLEAYQHRQATILQQRGRYGSDHPDPVAATWSLSFRQIEKESSLAADVLRCCAFLAPNDIPEDLIVEEAIEFSPSLQPLVNDPTLLHEAIGKLTRFSLVHRNIDHHTLSIHQLVQAVLKNAMTQEEQQQWAERTIRANSKVFPDVKPDTWRQCQHYLPHALVCADHIKQWSITSSDATHLLEAIVFYLQDRAQYAEAERLCQYTLSIFEKKFGKDHPYTASSLNTLALLYHEQGKYELAEPLYQRAISICEQKLGKDHPYTASSLDNLATLYRKQGKYELAELLCQRALSIFEQVFGKDHPDTATNLNNLANLYYEKGKYELAEPLYERALSIREQRLGKNHPDTASSLNNLASLYARQGKHELAESLYQRALSISEQVLGMDHPTTKTFRKNYTRFQNEQI